MKKIFFLLAIAAFAASCSESKKTEETDGPKADPDKDRVALTFKVLKHNDQMISIDAWVKNNSDKTIYFIAPNCNGIVYSLLYDASVLRLHIQSVCEVPEVEKIAIKPHDSYPFHAVFLNTGQAEKMRLALDFMEVPEEYDVAEAAPDPKTVYKRSESDQNIIQGTEIK